MVIFIEYFEDYGQLNITTKLNITNVILFIYILFNIYINYICLDRGNFKMSSI